MSGKKRGLIFLSLIGGCAGLLLFNKVRHEKRMTFPNKIGQDYQTAKELIAQGKNEEALTLLLPIEKEVTNKKGDQSVTNNTLRY